MPTTEELSAEALKLTERLIDCAEQGMVDEFKLALSERLKLLNLIENTQTASGDLVKTQENLEKTRALNQLLEADFKKQQQHLMDDKSALTRGNKMRKAYLQR